MAVSCWSRLLRLGNPAPVTLGLVIVNIIVFAYGILSNSQNYIISHYGFMPDQLFRYHQTADSALKIFTSMFIHAGIAHIAFNLFALVYMGGFAERALGKGRYILVYMIAGIGGALFHGVIASYLLTEGQAVLIGASGPYQEFWEYLLRWEILGDTTGLQYRCCMFS